METLAQLIPMEGSDMVIGANDGISFDPAWAANYWKDAVQHRIVWVEPNPWLFGKLSKNTESVPNKVTHVQTVRCSTLHYVPLPRYPRRNHTAFPCTHAVYVWSKISKFTLNFGTYNG